MLPPWERAIPLVDALRFGEFKTPCDLPRRKARDEDILLIADASKIAKTFGVHNDWRSRYVYEDDFIIIALGTSIALQIKYEGSLVYIGYKRQSYKRVCILPVVNERKLEEAKAHIRELAYIIDMEGKV